MGNGHVGSAASLEMVDTQEVCEGSEPNTCGEYTKWPPVTGVTTDATTQLVGIEPSLKLEKKNKLQPIFFSKLGIKSLIVSKCPNGQTNDLVNFVQR